MPSAGVPDGLHRRSSLSPFVVPLLLLHMPTVPTVRHFRIWLFIALLYFYCSTASFAEISFDTRYQYYQEGDGRVGVNSEYSLFSIDLSETLALDGTFLYSALSGASPTGLPPDKPDGQVPTQYLEDERYAATLGLAWKVGAHTLRPGVSFSYEGNLQSGLAANSWEGDYLSIGVSLQDTISLNQKNTELVLGLAYTHDDVGANGSDFAATKRTYDAMIGVNQLLGPDTILTFNLGFGWREGYLSDPYKRVLINNEVYYDQRPSRKFEQTMLLQLTHFIEPWDASVEASYRFGYNTWGSFSHTFMLSFYKYFLNKRIVIRPSIRFYDQTAAWFYGTEFSGNPAYASADYRLASEATLTVGLQVRWNIIMDRLALDVGYERYNTWGVGNTTSQTAFPDANSFTVGFHFQM